MLDFVAQTAKDAGLEDYCVVVNVGPGGGQTIFHLHWHVLGGGGWARICMSLIGRLEEELREATLARNAERRDTLRLILTRCAARRRSSSVR